MYVPQIFGCLHVWEFQRLQSNQKIVTNQNRITIKREDYNVDSQVELQQKNNKRKR